MRHQKPVKRLQEFLLSAGQKLPKYGADGEFGAETTLAIDLLDVPNYVKKALKEVGIYEIHGGKHHPRVLEYHRSSAGKYSNDEVPWCGSFVNWVLRKSGYETIGVPERAKAWLDFGLPIDEPVMGAIAVKSRKGGGHVAIVVGESPDGKLWCVGGNQNDEVNLSLYSREVFEGFRVPGDYEMRYALVQFDGTAGEVKEA